MNNPSCTVTSDSEAFTAKLSELRDLIAELAQCAPKAASEGLQTLKSQATAKAGEAAKFAVKTVKENPLQVGLAVAGAGLAGVLAWYLISRNSGGGSAPAAAQE
jgi:hypothetical protein